MKGLIRPITFKVKEKVTTLALLVFTNLSLLWWMEVKVSIVHCTCWLSYSISFVISRRMAISWENVVFLVSKQSLGKSRATTMETIYYEYLLYIKSYQDANCQL